MIFNRYLLGHYCLHLFEFAVSSELVHDTVTYFSFSFYCFPKENQLMTIRRPSTRENTNYQAEYHENFDVGQFLYLPDRLDVSD